MRHTRSRANGSKSGSIPEVLLIRLAGAVRWAGQPRLQWTTAQDGPLKGTPREAMPQCAAATPPKTSRVLQRLHARPAQEESRPVRGRSPGGLGRWAER